MSTTTTGKSFSRMLSIATSMIGRFILINRLQIHTFPDDLGGVQASDLLVANPGVGSPSEAVWIEIGYFYAQKVKNPGDFCHDLIIIWQEGRNPKWSIDFVKKAGYVVSTFEEAKNKLRELIDERR